MVLKVRGWTQPTLAYNKDNNDEKEGTINFIFVFVHVYAYLSTDVTSTTYDLVHLDTRSGTHYWCYMSFLNDPSWVVC